MAVAAAKLGAQTAFIGKAGNDAFGTLLANTLEANGVYTGGFIRSDDNTTLAVVSVDAAGERSFAFYRKGFADTLLTAEDISDSQLQNTHFLHFGSVSLTDEPSRSATLSAVKRAKAYGATITYDPNYRESLWDNPDTAITMMKQPLGEVVMEPSKVAPYFGTPEKPERHMLYNVTTMASTWHTVATKDVRLLHRQTEQLAALPKDYIFLNYLRCHDDIGWGLDYAYLHGFGMEEIPHKKCLNDYFTGKFEGSPSRGDARLCGTTASLCGIEAALQTGDTEALQTAVDCDIMLHAYMLTQSGIPVIYSGDEIAQLNDES